MKKIIIFCVILLNSNEIFPQTVPANYQDLYDELSLKLQFIDSTMTAEWGGSKFCTNYATLLLPAASNRGESLLVLQVLKAVGLYLDAYDSLGLSAVDISIQYPILVESFPRYNEYLNFYKQVIDSIRNKNFKLIIGCQSTFRDSVFGGLPVDEFYEGLDKERYKSEKKQMIETIINELQPDYLTVETEPATQERNLGLDFSPQSVIEYIQYFLDGLDKKGVLIGGGSGTWDEIDYIDLISQQPGIDYIDFHIYPIIADSFIDKVFKIDSLATYYNKKLVLGECWLHKANADDLATLEPNEIFVRDIYSFWIPLDSLFFESVIKLSHFSKIELTSLIWPTQLFEYIEYDEEFESWPLNQLYDSAYAASTPKILSKAFSQTGELYYSLIKESCESTTSLEENKHIPYGFSLEQNYPNPFNPSTVISWQLAVGNKVTLKIYDLLGREVKTLVDEYKSPGKYETFFEDVFLPSGIYFYRIDSGDYSDTRKMILIK